MRATAATSRRDSSDVIGLAALAGACSAAPITFLSLLTIPMQESLRRGTGLEAALGSSLPTSEDWEILPFFLLAALVVGAVAASVAALAWLFIDARAPQTPWQAHVLGAGLVAALSALFWLVSGQWAAAGAAGLLAGLVALVAAPRIGYQRRRQAESSLTSTALPD